MNLKQSIKKKRSEYPKKMPTLKRIKAGRIINVVAALPLGTSWMAVVGVPMTMAINPKVWIKGKINQRKGNGDLIL